MFHPIYSIRYVPSDMFHLICSIRYVPSKIFHSIYSIRTVFRAARRPTKICVYGYNWLKMVKTKQPEQNYLKIADVFSRIAFRFLVLWWRHFQQKKTQCIDQKKLAHNLPMRANLLACEINARVSIIKQYYAVRKKVAEKDNERSFFPMCVYVI